MPWLVNGDGRHLFFCVRVLDDDVLFCFVSFCFVFFYCGRRGVLFYSDFERAPSKLEKTRSFARDRQQTGHDKVLQAKARHIYKSIGFANNMVQYVSDAMVEKRLGLITPTSIARSTPWKGGGWQSPSAVRTVPLPPHPRRRLPRLSKRSRAIYTASTRQKKKRSMY